MAVGMGMNWWEGIGGNWNVASHSRTSPLYTDLLNLDHIVRCQLNWSGRDFFRTLSSWVHFRWRDVDVSLDHVCMKARLFIVIQMTVNCLRRRLRSQGLNKISRGEALCPRWYMLSSVECIWSNNDSVATFYAFLSGPSLFRYSSPFRNGSATKNIFPWKTQIFRLSLVAMAISLERLPNECKIYQALT